MQSLADIHPRSTERLLDETFGKALEDAMWQSGDIERIACVTGPGGFMSIRSGAAFANALQFALDIPAAGVHLSDLAMYQSSDEDVWWLHSTKKDLLFVRGFGRYADMQSEPEVKTLEEVKLLLHAEDGFIGELIDEHQAMLTSMGLVRSHEKPIQEILPAFLTSLTYAKQTLLPWYGRGI